MSEAKRERTILFVDDEEMSRKYFRKIFRNKFTVLTAGDGKEALDLFARMREEIGLVVTDQMMPRVTGLDVLAEIERKAPEVIRLLSTAYVDYELMSEASDQELVDYVIIKPWEIERVSATLEEAAEQFARGGER